MSKSSVFGDPIWKMDSLISLPGLKSGRRNWDFTKTPGFPGGFALSMAEFAYARLYTPVASHGRTVQWLTVHNELNILTRFVEFCNKQGLREFSEVTTLHFAEYLRELQRARDSGTYSTERLNVLVKSIYLLWEFSSKITCGLKKIPFGKEQKKLLSSNEGASYENRTPAIPDVVFSSVISSALDYVLEHSSTIFKAWESLCRYWDNYLSRSGLSQRAMKRRLHEEATLILEKVPATWRTEPWSGLKSLYYELQHLKAASMLVTLALSGVRASELLSIRAGCCTSELTESGKRRYYLKSITHKHRPGGSKDSWVVVEEVAKAILVLEKLTARARLETGDSRLFLSNGSAVFFSLMRSFERDRLSELTFESLTLQISSFQKHCSTVLNKPIPEWPDKDGCLQPWKFNTRQLRRTLARHIARQPFGIIAGMLQYKHLESTIFEGYAGTEPEWNKLLSDEKVLASVDILDEVAIDLSNGDLGGERGQQLKIAFEAEFKGRAEDFPASQIAKWLASKAKPLFVGKFNLCFFDSAKARCTRADAGAPVLNQCQPENCANACIAKRHLPNWQAQLKQAEEFAAHPKASKIHREAMASEIAKLRTVIANFRSEP